MGPSVASTTSRTASTMESTRSTSPCNMHARGRTFIRSRRELAEAGQENRERRHRPRQRTKVATVCCKRIGGCGTGLALPPPMHLNVHDTLPGRKRASPVQHVATNLSVPIFEHSRVGRKRTKEGAAAAVAARNLHLTPKSAWPGVSTTFRTFDPHTNLVTLLMMVIPRSRSKSLLRTSDEHNW